MVSLVVFATMWIALLSPGECQSAAKQINDFAEQYRISEYAVCIPSWPAPIEAP